MSRPVTIVFGLLPLLLANSATARTWYVTPDGTGDVPTIQDAIDLAAAGDIIELADGTYRGNGNRDIDFSGKAVTVRSQSQSPASCRLDCEGQYWEPHRGFVFDSGETASSVLEGVTIMYANVEATFNPIWSGAAVLCVSSSPTLSHCHFVANRALVGGAIGCVDSSPTISDCVFLANYGSELGGAIDSRGSSPTISDCVFQSNHTVWNRGSGIACHSQSTALIERCVFLYNIGGPVVWGTGAHLVRCTFHRNSCGADGSIHGYNLTIENSIIRQTLGGPAVTCGTGPITLICCDLFENALGDWVGCVAGQGGVNGNFSADPLFCDAEGGDCRLQWDSPCLPANSGGCGLIGRFGFGGCSSVALEPETWARVKARYRK